MSDRLAIEAVPSAKLVDKDINVPDNDTISRQGVLRLLNAVPSEEFATKAMLISGVKALPSAQPDLDEWCRDCKEYDQERHSCPRWNRVIRQTVEDLKAEAQPDITKDYVKAVLAWFVDYQVKCASLNGRYTPYEVLGWVVNDWRRENGI